MRSLVPMASLALILAASISATAAVPHAVPNAGASAVAPAALASTATANPRATGSTTPTATATTARVAPSGAFAWPLSPRPTVLRPFVQPQSQWSPGHRGVDLSAAVGQPVLSAGEGFVAFSGAIAGRGVITILHSGDLRTTYEPVNGRVAAGAVVRRGDRIGAVSPAAGHCAPVTCLHWGAISGQIYRDPLTLLGFGRPILLPLG